MHQRAVRVILAAASVLLAASAASGQTTVRVTAERVSIWRPGFLTVATVVDRGTVLEVLRRQGEWLEVVVPGRAIPPASTGFVALGQVEVVSGSLPADRAPALPRAGQRVGPARPGARLAAVDSGLRGFADAGLNWFLARDTFNAIVDQARGTFFGGGIEFRARDHAFVQAAVRVYRRSGERVFVEDDEVFPLGIDDRITIVPIAVTIGYRFGGTGAVPYVGGGAGGYFLRERSEFADPTDDVDEQFPSYHALAGIEWRNRSWIAAAVEVQFTHVPNALSGAVADALGEHNLGGLEARVKVVFGR